MNILEKTGDYPFIFHISDIHIRLNSRKEEYEYVFSQLYKTLKAHPHVRNSVIVITGDLLHNKIDLTPECILMSYSFLNSLGQIAPTFLIAGNHDALLNNRDRLESITSILHHRTPENVYYLKDSGYYQFGNILFAVNSLLQENPDEWLDILKDQQNNPDFFENKICIGLYHGQICGWKNNLGYSSESGDKAVNDFKGFDLILLGDIHKYQYMNKEKTMAYSGSLISQNFGETDPDHGVLCWNLLDKSSQFYPITNPYCYTEAVLEDEYLRLLYYREVPPIHWTNPKELQEYIPKYTNIRVFMSLDTHINHDFIKAFKKAMPHARLQQKFATKQTVSLNPVAREFNPDGTNEPFWIRTFVLERLDGNPITLVEKLISDLQLEFTKNVTVQKSGGYTDWEIEEIKFDNLFGYGSDNIIPFKKLASNTITGIFGKNSFGKSTIIDIISFLLFGKITRGTTGNTIPKEIINHLEKKASGELVFKVGNQRYKITKQCTRQKNDKIKIVEHFYVYEPSKQEWTDYSEEHRKKTDKIIESLLGNMESFIFTNVCLQQRDKQFREMTQKDRKEFLYNLFGLDWFEKYRKDKEDALKVLKGEEKVYREKVGEHSSQSWEEKSTSLKASIEGASLELQELKEQLLKIEKTSQGLLKAQQNSSFTNLKIANKKKLEIQKQLESTLELEKSQIEEKAKIVDYLELYDLYSLKRDLERIELEIKSMEECNDIVSDSDPEVQKWIVKGTKKDFQQYYKKVQNILERSTEISEQWNKRKSELDGKILEINCQAIQYDTSLVSMEEWEQLCLKIGKMQHDILILENKLLEVIPELDHDMEVVIEKFQHYFHEYEKHQCKIQSLRLQLKDTGKMEINPDCSSCVKNSTILKQAKQEKELSDQELQCKVSMEKMQGLVLEIRKKWTHVPENQSIEMLHSFFIKEIQRLKEIRIESIRKREQCLKKLESYKILKEKHTNTKNYRQCCENERIKKQLEDALESDPLKQEYQEMLLFFKKNKMYQEINQYWEKQNDTSILQLQENQANITTTLSKYQQKKQKLEGLEKSWIELKESRILLDIELKKVEEQVDILEENEKLVIKSNELEKKKEKSKALLEEKTKLLHGYQTDLEKLDILKKEWFNNMEKWKQCQETMDTATLLINCIDRDGLPLYLLKMYLPIIENEINQLIHTFLDKKMVLKVHEKDVIVGIGAGSSTETGSVSNYMGGMEAFMVDLSLKMVFSKFSRQPKSNFFIIDEGISVFDQERISNIGVLFNFLTSISEQVFLISHLPTIKDFVTQSIEIMKDSKGYSQVHCFF
jgi:DNA repair exonuclease SbcCD ATPase subunit